ncbi:hypothetical protein PTSG_00532 [Salpingoeca rosetta]|uniref:Uncharacterized protein n=1 Tax=Salpingoeca rosetta (strain ATCC 50818 / BSB-021) TaxID=946362 RepID=F2TWR0_SALR5|nr:uncharacterized protein PTSG_00532 [Salpingoeca rosetta]EGD72506.1 hypothetical protein PTSG_00532 [Salpingoeca rosetta]|eukprot:XP_004999075.1 hypothetical protein PTSG_00532 [Salpingoeca rosetta]
MAGIPRVGGVVVVSLVVAAALLLVAVPQHARAASSSATATTTPSSTTQATLCHVDEGALARIYPIVHNCTHLEAGQTCVSHCDESRQFSGEPLRIKCTSSGVTDPPFPQMQCTRRRHHIQTTEDGIVITAYQGDVIARVGETTVGVLELDADVSTIHTRLSEIEAQDLNPRVEDLEQGFPLLSSELSAVNASQSAQVAASVSSLRADLSDAVNDAMQSRQDLDTELRTRITAAENTARTNIENATALLSQQVAAASLSLESELQDLNTAFSEVVDNALESVGSVESRVDSHDTTLSAQTADISTTSMELSAVAERVDTAEEDIDLVQGMAGFD